MIRRPNLKPKIRKTSVSFQGVTRPSRECSAHSSTLGVRVDGCGLVNSRGGGMELESTRYSVEPKIETGGSEDEDEKLKGPQRRFSLSLPLSPDNLLLVAFLQQSFFLFPSLIGQLVCSIFSVLLNAGGSIFRNHVTRSACNNETCRLEAGGTAS
jgi:hypothetical protein